MYSDGVNGGREAARPDPDADRHQPPGEGGGTKERRAPAHAE